MPPVTTETSTAPRRGRRPNPETRWTCPSCEDVALVTDSPPVRRECSKDDCGHEFVPKPDDGNGCPQCSNPFTRRVGDDPQCPQCETDLESAEGYECRITGCPDNDWHPVDPDADDDKAARLAAWMAGQHLTTPNGTKTPDEALQPIAEPHGEAPTETTIGGRPVHRNCESEYLAGRGWRPSPACLI